MKLPLIFTFLILAVTGYSQDSTNTFTNPCEKNGEHFGVYTVVEQMPQFGAGQEELLKYLSEKLVYPEFAKEQEIWGTVYLRFIVNIDGSLCDIQVLRGVAEILDQEALRVVKGMPKWTPGMQRGKPVPVQFSLPVKFSLL